VRKISVHGLLFILLTFQVSIAADDQPQQQQGTVSQIVAEFKKGLISYEESLIFRLQAVRQPSDLPDRFRSGSGVEYSRSATSIFREAFQALPKLSASAQSTVLSLMARPSATHTFNSPRGWFKMQYNISGPNAVPTADVKPVNGIPDYIDRCADYCDSAWQTEVINLGYLTPPSDGTGGGDSRYDIYFEEMPYYGYTAPEAYGPQPWNDATSYISMHRNFMGFPPNTDPDGNQWGAAKATAAHEFFHAVQMGYDLSEDLWFMELSSTWMEDIVFDTVNDNYNYSYDFFNYPWRGIASEAGLHMYAAFVWDKYLEERFDTSLVRQIWEGCRYTSSLTAMSDSIALYGYTLDSAFAEFETWVYRTEYRDDDTGFDEADSYPDVLLRGNHNSYPVGWISSTVKPEGMGSVFIRFMPGSAEGRLVLSFDGLDSRDWDVYMIASENNTTHWQEKMVLDPSTKEGTIGLYSFEDYQQAILCVVNNSENSGGSDFSYAAEINQAYGMAIMSNDTVGFSGTENLAHVTISNISGFADVLDFIFNDSLGWAVSPSSGSLVMDPGTDTTIEVTIATTPGTPLCERDRLYLTAQSQGDPSLIENTSFLLEIIAQHGDANFDGAIDVGDAVYVISYIFKGGGAPIPIMDAGDANCDLGINVGDAVYIINYVFKSGPKPPCNP
jgi:hypothetical protein